MSAPTVSMVTSATATATRDVGSESIIEAIRTGGKQRLRIQEIRHKFRRVLQDGGDSKAAKKAVDPEKKKLPAVTWSGRFLRRANEALVIHSGLLCADLDGLGDNLPALREKIAVSPYLWAMFLSPTADGLKAIFRVRADAKLHRASFRAVEKHVLELTGVMIDGSRKDLAGLCFVSYDPDAYYNPDAIELPPLLEKEKRTLPFNQSVLGLNARRELADGLLGDVAWTTGTHGYCACPGHHLHTTGDGEHDCKIHLDGAPTLHCFHNSCAGIRDNVNHELRSRIGKAESGLEQTDPARIESKNPIVEQPLAPAPYKPPPLDLLPWEVREYIRAAAVSLNVDVSYILLPLLSALGSAIGSSRSVRLKAGFIQPPIIWSGIIGRSGSRKSPALDAGCFAVTEHERELMRRHQAACAEYDEHLAAWEGEQKKDWGAKPEPPPSLTCLMDDLTLAALADAMETNPRGVLVKKDELSNWFAGMDQFHDGKGADVSRWLSLHTGAFFGLDRKTDRRRSRLFDPRVCITGGIQPAVLSRVLTQDFFERGLPARFLFAAPPARPDKWSESSIAPQIRTALAQVMEKLYLMCPEQAQDGTSPKLLPLNSDAKAAFVSYYNECGIAAADADEREEAAWSKLSGYAARLALVGQCARDPDADVVTGEVMVAACDLARWFGAEAVRIYATMSETTEQSFARRVVEFIERRGGAVTVRDVVTYHRPLKNQTERATQELNALERAGHGIWKPAPSTKRGGKPTRRFWLHSHEVGASASAIPPVFPRERGGYADADGAEERKTQPVPELEEAFF